MASVSFIEKHTNPVDHTFNIENRGPETPRHPPGLADPGLVFAAGVGIKFAKRMCVVAAAAA